MKKISVAFLLLLIGISALQANPGIPGHETGSGFLPGILHPLVGFDHLLAMVAVGLWAAQIGGRAVWMVPTCFVLAMLGGGIAGISGFHLPYMEQGIALSVLLLGLVIAFAFKPPLYVPAILVAAFAIFHGAAHGLEMPANASGLAYGLGFLLATTFLHTAGIALGIGLKKVSTTPLVRSLGGITAALGAYLLIA